MLETNKIFKYSLLLVSYLLILILNGCGEKKITSSTIENLKESIFNVSSEMDKKNRELFIKAVSGMSRIKTKYTNGKPDTSTLIYFNNKTVNEILAEWNAIKLMIELNIGHQNKIKDEILSMKHDTDRKKALNYVDLNNSKILIKSIMHKIDTLKKDEDFLLISELDSLKRTIELIDLNILELQQKYNKINETYNKEHIKNVKSSLKIALTHTKKRLQNNKLTKEKLLEKEREVEIGIEIKDITSSVAKIEKKLKEYQVKLKDQQALHKKYLENNLKLEKKLNDLDLKSFSTNVEITDLETYLKNLTIPILGM